MEGLSGVVDLAFTASLIELRLVCAGFIVMYALSQLVDCYAHTDALFGLVASVIRESDLLLQTPEDVMQLLDSRLRPMMHARGEDFKITYIESVRNVSIMFPQLLSLADAYSHQGREAPHSFMFCARKFLSQTAHGQLDQGRPYSDRTHPDDVFCLVKQWMADRELSQRPLLVCPASFHVALAQFMEDVNNNPIVMHRTWERERMKGLRDLAAFLETYNGLYSPAVAYLTRLANVDRYHAPPPPPLAFLSHGQRRIRSLAVPSAGDIDPAFIPKRLSVSFSNAGQGLAIEDAD